MTRANIVLWVLGFGGQAALCALLLRRRIAAQLPLFTFLVAFYCVRSFLLLAISRGVSADNYRAWAETLSLLDLVLQVSVAFELGFSLRSPLGGSRLARAVPLAASLALAASLTWVAASLAPARSPAPADRGVVFTGLLFGLMFLWSLWRQDARAARIVLTGLAVTGTVNVLSQIEKSWAAVHRDAGVFTFWSYTGACAYLAALSFWLIFLWQGSSTKEDSSQPALDGTLPSAIEHGRLPRVQTH